MNRDRCAMCDTIIVGVQHISGLYKSSHLLCEWCGKKEEMLIDEKGTNDIPELLTSYGLPNFHYKEGI